MRFPLLWSSASLPDRDLSLKGKLSLMTEFQLFSGNRTNTLPPLPGTNMGYLSLMRPSVSTIASKYFSIDRSHWYVPEFSFQHSPNVVVVKAGLTNADVGLGIGHIILPTLPLSAGRIFNAICKANSFGACPLQGMFRRCRIHTGIFLFGPIPRQQSFKSPPLHFSPRRRSTSVQEPWTTFRWCQSSGLRSPDRGLVEGTLLERPRISVPPWVIPGHVRCRPEPCN